MLINTTFFVGNINIPGAGAGGPVDASLNWFIKNYETEFMRIALGGDLYFDFMTGLGLASDGSFSNVANGVAAVGTVQIWKDLLNGKEYTGMDARLHKWKGLVSVGDDAQTIKKSPIANY